MKKRRVLLSGVSILLVLCLLIGGTMAWFTDTEKTDADFTAGVLDITVEPGEGATAPLTFVNLRPMQYQNFLEEINDAGNGNANVDGYDPKPVYFQPVVCGKCGDTPGVYPAFSGSFGYGKRDMPGRRRESNCNYRKCRRNGDHCAEQSKR